MVPNIQKKILEWRFATDNLAKKILGFWIKAFVEGPIMTGVPFAVFILLVTELTGLSLPTALQIPGSGHPRLIAWFSVTGYGYWKIRCILLDGFTIVEE